MHKMKTADCMLNYNHHFNGHYQALNKGQSKSKSIWIGWSSQSFGFIYPARKKKKKETCYTFA